MSSKSIELRQITSDLKYGKSKPSYWFSSFQVDSKWRLKLTQNNVHFALLLGFCLPSPPRYMKCVQQLNVLNSLYRNLFEGKVIGVIYDMKEIIKALFFQKNKTRLICQRDGGFCQRKWHWQPGWRGVPAPQSPEQGAAQQAHWVPSTAEPGAQRRAGYLQTTRQVSTGKYRKTIRTNFFFLLRLWECFNLVTPGK